MIENYKLVEIDSIQADFDIVLVQCYLPGLKILFRYAIDQNQRNTHETSQVFYLLIIISVYLFEAHNDSTGSVKKDKDLGYYILLNLDIAAPLTILTISYTLQILNLAVNGLTQTQTALFFILFLHSIYIFQIAIYLHQPRLSQIYLLSELYKFDCLHIFQTHDFIYQLQTILDCIFELVWTICTGYYGAWHAKICYLYGIIEKVEAHEFLLFLTLQIQHQVFVLIFCSMIHLFQNLYLQYSILNSFYCQIFFLVFSYCFEEQNQYSSQQLLKN